MTNLFSRFKRGGNGASVAIKPEKVLPTVNKIAGSAADYARVIERITHVCRETAKGNFEARLINITEEGALGEAQHAVNDMIDRCDAFVREASAAMDAVRHHKYYRRIMREGLHGAVDTAAALINGATAAIERRVTAFDANTAQFERSIASVVDMLSNASSAMGDTAAKLSHGASITRERTTEVASATEDASANMQAVASVTAKLSGVGEEIRRGVDHSTQIARQAVDRTGEASRTMQELATAADRIGKSVALISSIASQTNLLALNAAIEAAHAGETGKGFAVVAQEVKMLSNQTTNATREIAECMGKVQSISKSAVEAIASINEIIDDIHRNTGKVMQGVIAQAAATDEIAKNVEHTSQGIQGINSAMRDVTENAGETESYAASTTVASSELLEQSHTLATDVQAFLLTLRRGAFDEVPVADGQTRAA